MSDPRKELLSRFLFSIDSQFYEPFSTLSPPEPLSKPFSAFKDNLKSAITVGTVPFTLALSATYNRRFHQLLIAERIRAHAEAEEASSPEEISKIAFDSAFSKMRAEETNPESVHSSTEEILDFLESAIEEPTFSQAADDLLRQVLVMIWGAFEVLATDLAIELLNTAPIHADRLQGTKRYKASSISIETLKEHAFDLSKKMGLVLFENQRLDSLPQIQEAYSLLLDGDASLQAALKNPALWDLSQKRHLVVHRRGIIDAQYLKKTTDDKPIGSFLKTSNKELHHYLNTVRDIGIHITHSVVDRLISTHPSQQENSNK